MDLTGPEAAAYYQQLRAEMQHSTRHDYVSTACHHALHDRCRLVCKFCDVPCGCRCHVEESDAGR